MTDNMKGLLDNFEKHIHGVPGNLRRREPCDYLRCAIWKRLRTAVEKMEMHVSTLECNAAGVADTINQELRERGPVNGEQIGNYLDDIRPCVRLLVDYTARKAEHERDELKETNLNNVLCKDNEIQRLKRRLEGAHHKGCHCAGLPHQEGALVDPRCLALRWE